MAKRNIMIVGTGTIGEPLIGLLSSMQKKLGIGNVYFHKRTPLMDEVAKVNSLVKRGAKLVVGSGRIREFHELGHKSAIAYSDVSTLCDVIIDCTPAGNANKEHHYLALSENDDKKVFIAQGSEKGFGIPYAYGINDDALRKSKPNFIQVVSCNTHNIACLLKSLDNMCLDDDYVINGDFVCIRRSSDVSQDKGYVASPVISTHENMLHGTHHATDVVDLFKTLDTKFTHKLFSSALKINSQYMHVVRFSIVLKGLYSHEDVYENFQKNKFIALTHRKSVNRVFSFGRDHGFYGRIYNHTVVPVSSLLVCQHGSSTTVTGFCFTPQDGNSLLSSGAAAMHALHGDKYEKYVHVLDAVLHDII